MASPPPPLTKSAKLDYYYFVIGLTLVAIVLLLTNAIAVGCCARLRRFILSRGALGREFTEGDARRWMPTHTYMTRKDEEGAECAVCISAFEEGEEVRRMAQCGHSFHAGCIDMWLISHRSCPVCRENVIPTPLESMELSASFGSRDYVGLVSGSSSRSASMPVGLA